jgi:lysozyme
MPSINSAGLELVKRFEGCSLVAYADPVGVWTIGYGRTSGVVPGQTCTQTQAEVWLVEQLQEVANQVQNETDVVLNPNQFSALVSFAYNLGITALADSTLMFYVNQRKFDLAANEFSRWVYAGGRVLQGLVNRRAAEKALFLTPP